MKADQSTFLTLFNCEDLIFSLSQLQDFAVKHQLNAKIYICLLNKTQPARSAARRMFYLQFLPVRVLYCHVHNSYSEAITGNETLNLWLPGRMLKQHKKEKDASTKQK